MTIFFNEELNKEQLFDAISIELKSLFNEYKYQNFIELRESFLNVIDLDAVSGNSYQFVLNFIQNFELIKQTKYNCSLDEARLSIVNLVSDLMESMLRELHNEFSVYSKLNKIGIECANFEKNTFENFIFDVNNIFFGINEESTGWWLYDSATPTRDKENRVYLIDGKEYNVDNATDFLLTELSLKGLNLKIND